MSEGVLIAILGAVVSVGISVFSSLAAVKHEMQSFRLDKSVDIYEKVIVLLSKLQFTPMLVFKMDFLFECNSLRPLVSVYAEKEIYSQYVALCDEVKAICYEYQDKFNSDEVLKEKESISNEIPFVAELFEKEEDDYMLYSLLDSKLLPLNIEERINKICEMIRREMKIKSGDKNG